ncbi:serpin I2-like [Cimex lectularius]|uniref:Serpin domain-containing protein n=1 Tax=Cimex lectularius TaxID=79782 RepID=A0A8I6RA06_CIMLE|nr:serpin I2-like [Cimex lectularius]
MSYKMSAYGNYIIVVALVTTIPASCVSSNKNTFANQFYKQMSTFYGNKNLVCSPVGLKIAMAIMHAGSAGNTGDEIRKSMNFGEQSPNLETLKNEIEFLRTPGLRMTIKLFVNKNVTVKKTFEDDVNNISSAVGVGKVPFSEDRRGSAEAINNWTSSSTDKKIKEIVKQDDITSGTRLIIANAAHFLSKWKYAFDKKKTIFGYFTNLHNANTKVRYMTDTFLANYSQIVKLRAKILQLPFEDDAFQMIILLPQTNADLKFVEGEVSKMDMSEIVGLLQPTVIEVRLPVFKLVSLVNPRRPLQNLGIKQLFTPGADLRNISDSGIYVDKIIQKVSIEINENGNQTSPLNEKYKKNATLPRFYANTPFMFAIVDQTTTPLFCGKYTGENN